MTYAVLAEHVRTITRDHQVTQAAIAETLGLTQPTVSRKLAGSTPITAPEMAAIAALCGVGLDDMYPAPDTTQ